VHDRYVWEELPMRPEVLSIAGPHVIHEVFDDEVVIVNLESGRYYTMSEVGAGIWQLIRDGAAVEAICAAVNRQYDGAPAKMTAAVEGFLDELEREGLVVPAARDVATPYAPVSDEPGNQTRTFQPPSLHKYTDMEDLLLLDPIHEVDATGWPNRRPGPAAA
jgi:hypothetical protein